MRNQYSDALNNLSHKMKSSIQKRIDNSDNWDVNSEGRNTTTRRNGQGNFGAIQIMNIVDKQYAIFGSGTNRKVGR
jgi:hypothetical protein